MGMPSLIKVKAPPLHQANYGGGSPDGGATRDSSSSVVEMDSKDDDEMLVVCEGLVERAPVD